MTEIEVPYGDKPSDTATLLLAAAEELNLPAHVVRTTSDQVFMVPEEVAEKAGFGEKKKPAKKTASSKE
jgi:hypothetical protein